MKTLILDTITKTIKVKMSGVPATTNPDFVSTWADNNGTIFTEGSTDGALNGSSDVTLVSAPGASTRRIIKSISIQNKDTAAVTLTVKFDNNGTQRNIAVVTIDVGDTWTLEGTYNNDGSLKTTLSTTSLLKLDQSTPQTVQGRPVFDDGLQLGLTPTVGTHSDGKMFWDSTWKTPACELEDDVTLQIGQETMAYVYNGTGSPITQGKVVYTSGTQGGVPSVSLALGDTEATSKVLGVITSTSIADGSYGYATIRGHVNNIDTSSWNLNDELYLSADTAGMLTNVKPNTGDFDTRVARVMLKDATTGRIYVNMIREYQTGVISGGAGVEFFLDDTTIYATSANNTYPVKTLTKVPVTSTEDVDSISVTAVTSPVLYGEYLYNTGLGDTTIQGGVWTFDIYAGVSSATNVSSITQNIYRSRTEAGTITISDVVGTSATATASEGTPFAVNKIDPSATLTDSSFLMITSNTTGLYPITARVSDTVVTITVPAGYTPDAASTYQVQKKLFGITTGEINNVAIAPLYAGLQLYQITSVQPAYTILSTDELGTKMFGVSTGTRTIYFSHNGTERYSHFTSPLITRHNDLAGLQGGSSGEYYHLTSAQATIATQSATTDRSGYLTDTDWDIFNGKAAGTHASQHAVGGGDSIFPADPNADRYLMWDDSESALAWSSPGGGGQTLYECIVATSGGDYTTLGDALAAGKKRIFIRNGTYTETGTPTIPSNSVIVGESRDGVILDIDGTTNDRILIAAGNTTKVELRNFTVYKTNTGNYCITNAYASGDSISELIVDNVVFSGGGFRGGYAVDNNSKNLSFTNCIFTNNTGGGNGIYIRTAGDSLIDGYLVVSNCKTLGTFTDHGNFLDFSGRLKHISITNNIILCSSATQEFNGISVNNGTSDTGKTVISGNIFAGWGVAGGGAAITLSGGTAYTITGNTFKNNYRSILAYYPCLISGNIFEDGTVGVRVSGDNVKILSNTFKDVTTAISPNGGESELTIIANSFYNCTTRIGTPLEESLYVGDNQGLTPVEQYKTVLMKNTSGGALAAGDVVIIKSVAAGNEVTTTTSAGDNKVFGMAITTINDNSFGKILVEGKTTVLKVDGTTDIAVGDYLSCFTTAKIAKKASAGETVFAMALEAYTTDDSSGVIDALLITPRLI